MKKFLTVLMYALEIIGLSLSGCAAVRMVGGFEGFITTDKQWIMCLFGGILLCCGGFLIEQYLYQPVSPYYQHRRKVGIRDMSIVIGCCILFLGMVYWGL